VINLSERSVDEAIDNDQDSAVDFEILHDPSHPRYAEMRRRYHELEARDDPSDRD
jgi:hypothetical protein